MKNLIIGWIGKNRKLSEVLEYSYLDDLQTTCRISREKGNEFDWFPADRPPKKIQITVEDI